MTCPRRKRHTNTTCMLARRSRGIPDYGNILRANMRMLRAIVLQEDRNFIKVWSKTSKSTIAYDSGKIYFENYQSCYSCIDTHPQLLYKLPQRSKSEKIEDALQCSSPLEKSLSTPSDQKPCLLTLTANNWLYRLSAETGETLQGVYLSPNPKFKYLQWDEYQDRFYVKSIQNKVAPFARQAGITQNTVMHLAIFNVFPLEIVGMLEINKTVFGDTVTDVVLTQGTLAVSHSTKTVKLYSFDRILSEFMTKRLALGQPSPFHEGRTVGDAPYGIPLNIVIKDCPPVLFEVSCSDHNVQIGGHPWHYIYTPPHKKHRGTYHICSLAEGILAKNGIQDMDCCSLETDLIYLHPDESGRIIHVGPNTVKMLRCVSGLKSDSPSEVVEDFSITTCRSNVAPRVTVTSSGRTVKRISQQLDDDPDQETFRTVEYEDEVDLLALVVTDGEEGEGRACVKLHDNSSGALLKTIPLEQAWDVTYRNEMCFDKETIVHIEERNNGFHCHVYKLQTEAK
ncbi:DDB1- and CUL4-associated factor 17 isoform X2 [Gadus macrocephalus]|uniref:DDB1- and CUL4-associated factor 17 isoform X2 n=1 Tax=Gadus macrocephalus TaxID=80720 RepID=UPI0028CB8DC2|nr:DDB1- and CUL4-associated factor 17 isoform X2 [Gadus macrocephalus]